MKNEIPKIELMSPAGDWVSLQAAIDAGCNAIYFGLNELNMRATAKNFSVHELPEIVSRCHSRNVKAYLTLNTIIYESELDQIREIIAAAKKASVDAVICWDFAVISELLPQQIPVFASTQMSVANSRSLLFFYQNYGIKRFVLARECSLDDIMTIKKNLTAWLGESANQIELEVFAHGAMCLSVSGRCLLSHFCEGKSANRGECYQHCRREYLLTDLDGKEQFQVGNYYLLSPKDLCTLPFIEKLLDAGITSLKIEGRGRSAEYVSVVTSAYRQAIDFYCRHRHESDFFETFAKLKEKLLDDVKKVYNRGFSDGFYLGKPFNEWSTAPGTVATTRKVYVGKVTNYYRNQGVAEILVENGVVSIGDEIMIQGKTTGVLSKLIDYIEIEHQSVEIVSKGERFAVQVNTKVRPNDQVYLIQTVTS